MPTTRHETPTDWREAARWWFLALSREQRAEVLAAYRDSRKPQGGGRGK